MLGRILEHKFLTALAVTLCFVIFVVPINTDIAFAPLDANRSHVLLRSLLQGFFGLVFFLAAYYVLEFLQRLVNRDIVYRRWLKVSLAYFALNCVILLLIWPGYWVWDEFGELATVQNNGLGGWQTAFTSIYYFLCLNLIPSGVGIVIVQSVVSAVVVGYVVARTSEQLRHKYLALLLLIPFLSAPVLLNNFYPLRLTMYSYLEVLVLFRLIVIVRDPALVRNRYREFLFLSLAVMLLAFWRAEGIYYLLVLPFLAIHLRLYRIHGQRVLAVLASVLCLAIVGGGFWLTKATSQAKYQLTASLNPLSMMLQEPLRGADLEKNLSTLDSAVDLKMVRAMPSAYEVPSFWAGAARSDVEKSIGAYNRAFVSLVFSNPGSFVLARVKTFLSANGWGGPPPHVYGYLSYLGQSPPEVAAANRQFEEHNAFSKPINEAVRQAVVRSLIMIDGSNVVTWPGKIVWSVIPVGALLLVALGLAVGRGKIFYSALILLVLTRIALIFLTAPANYFMYYLPAFMSGWLLLSYFVTRRLDRGIVTDWDPWMRTRVNALRMRFARI